MRERAFFRFPILLAIVVLPALAQPIVPRPSAYTATGCQLAVPDEISISSTDPELASLIPRIALAAERFFGLSLEETGQVAFIELRRDRELTQREAYRILIGPETIVVEAGAAPGCFYGLQSVLQLIAHSPGVLTTGVIEDAPRYAWRGVMLDESRHFFGVDQVKSILDLMALHKLNRFHWHLTDTSGWRIEIRKYPLLTEVGARGNDTDPKAPARYYSQREIKEIVRYAEDRFIEVIPEIDMPGHAAAAVRAYPALSGGGSRENPHFTFNPGKEETYTFLTDVLREVAALFPSQYIHLGGDEVHFGSAQWGDLPEVRDLMEGHQLADVAAVEQFFLRRMAGVVESLGKTVVVWDEALAAGLSSEDTVVMWWRHNRPQALQQALDRGYRVVLCPRIPLYFDFVQHATHAHGRKWDREFVPIESVYRFPAPQFTGDVSVDDPLILGMQANVWTPTMHTPERLQFMLYPRLSALAEAAWTAEESKDWDHFDGRMRWILQLLERAGIHYHDYAGDPEEETPGPQAARTSRRWAAQSAAVLPSRDITNIPAVGRAARGRSPVS